MVPPSSMRQLCHSHGRCESRGFHLYIISVNISTLTGPDRHNQAPLSESLSHSAEHRPVYGIRPYPVPIRLRVPPYPYPYSGLKNLRRDGTGVNTAVYGVIRDHTGVISNFFVVLEQKTTLRRLYYPHASDGGDVSGPSVYGWSLVEA